MAYPIFPPDSSSDTLDPNWISVEERASFEVCWFVCCIFHERRVSILVDARRERDDRSRDPRRWRGTNHARSRHWTRFIIRDARVCEKLRFFTAHGGFTARDRGDYAATRVYQKPSKLVRHPCVSPASASSSRFFKKHGKNTAPPFPSYLKLPLSSTCKNFLTEY